MGRLPNSVPGALPLLLAVACVACGGGSSSYQAPPPPPPPPPSAADFSFSLSPSTLTVTQGASNGILTVSVTGQNGFAGDVQLTLSGIPAEVSSIPASPFSVAAGTVTTVVFGAAPNAPAGNFTISAQAVSGALAHTASLALTVQTGVSVALPRTTFIRNDSVPGWDSVAGEPHHRHIAYDAVRKHIFVANRAMNRVEVFSTTDQTLTAQFSVPGADSVDISPDGTTLWVGTATQKAVAIDASSLVVSSRLTIPGLSPIPDAIFDRPEELLSVAGAHLFVRLRQSARPEALLALWSPTDNSLANLTAVEPQLFQNGLGVMARTGDHSKVLIAANDTSGEIAIFDANGNVIAGPRGLGAGTIPLVAANADGSRFAVVLVSNGSSLLILLDGALNPVNTSIPLAASGLAFSNDGNFLYVSQREPALSAVAVVDAHTLSTIGQVPDVAIWGVNSQIEEASETHLLFGMANRGVSFVDAAKPANLSAPAPSFASGPVCLPSEGPNRGGTATVLSGSDFSALSQLNFGAQAAAGYSLAAANQIQAASPASTAAGSVNVAAYFSNGWLALAPEAFSYGPQILQVTPNAGNKAGGEVVEIYGYGFGTDAGKINVKIGGTGAVVQKVENISSFAPSLGLEGNYPFSLQRITLTTPAGTTGNADVSVISSAGNTLRPRAFQFLTDIRSVSRSGLFKFAVYDRSRQWLYLSNLDHVDVFDLASSQFRAGILQPPGGPSPNAALRGMALTPDGSQLVVADFGAQNIYLLDPDKNTGTTVPVGGVPGFTNSGPARVAATSTHSVFVGLSGEGGGSGVCAGCLGQLDLTANPLTVQPAPQPEVTTLTGAPLVQGTSAGDEVYVAFGAAPGGQVALWNASSPNQFTIATANSFSTDLAAAADGTAFALQANDTLEIRASDLSLAAVPSTVELLQIRGRVPVPGVVMHPSGALVYQPFLTGQPASSGVRGGIDILDARTGVLRLRIFLPQQFMTDTDGLHGSFLATDEKGQRLFAITSADGTPQKASISIVQLASVPLGIGTVSPLSVPASSGAIITIRGSGFLNTSMVKVGGKSAVATLKDASTLSVTLPTLPVGAQQLAITNPGGETVSLDAAFIAN